MVREKWKIFSYGFLALPLSILGVSYYVFLPSWYVEDFGASIGKIGIYLMLARFWDALTDPLIGILSDRYKNKFFGRQGFIGLGTLLAIPSIYFLFNPVDIKMDVNIFFILISCLFYFSLTCIAIPFEAFGVEYSGDPLMRSRLIASRDGMLLFGTILASVFPYIIVSSDSNSSVDRNFQLSMIYISILIISFVMFFLTFKGRNKDLKTTNNSIKLDAVKLAVFNKNFIILLIAFVISSLGAALPAALFMFFVKNYLGLAEADAIRSLLVYFVVGLSSVPVWLFIGNKFNKKRVWFISQILNAGAFLPVYFLSSGNSEYFNIFIFFSALGLGGALILPSIIQADYIHSLQQRVDDGPIQGLVVGVWSVARKFSQGIGTGIGFYILSFYDFDPKSVSNSLESLNVLGLLYAVAPSVLCFVSILVATRYRIDDY